jgi:hypothetical protein
VSPTLCQQEYWTQKREAKGLVRQYLARMTGLGRAQVTRLIGRYKEDGEVKERSYERNRFEVRYTAADTELLANDGPPPRLFKSNRKEFSDQGLDQPFSSSFD